MAEASQLCEKHGTEKVLWRGGVRRGKQRWKWVCRKCASERLNNCSGRREWDQRNREKRRAQKRVENALVTGKITRQPCERCGSTHLVHAHHDDYARPLDVMWLCPLHHKERHRELGSSLNCRAVSAERPGAFSRGGS